jgi:hypothetical protein
MDRLVITIHPTPSDEGLLRVSDAMEQVIDALRVFEQAERVLVSPEEYFEWRLERASAGSPFTVVAVADPLKDAAQAHRDLESRKTVGSTVLTV